VFESNENLKAKTKRFQLKTHANCQDSCFVEFASEAEAKEAVTAGPLKHKDATVESKSK
jgi:hypothetical protein